MLNFTLLSLAWGFLAPAFVGAQIGSITPTPDPIFSASATASPNPSPSSSAGPRPAPADDPPDVLLRIPELHVGRIQLDVDDVRAEINLAAEIAGLVEINAGVQVGIKKVNITIANVDAELELDVRLGNLVGIVSRTLKSLDLNPLLVNVLDTTAALVTSVVGSVDGLLGSITNKSGNTVKVMIDNLGNIVEEAEEGRPASIVGDYRQNMTYTGAQTFLEGGLTQRTYSYPPLKAMVNIVTNAAGNVVQAVVVGKVGQSGATL
ncbi:hypothetical protein PG996_011238 [Apiospora saccharicola]|uniref:Uncharacterized protein n=1 Tax=Apiospora saccharicola TaxID=335842 RepID=A0ABR1UEH7_9PEZI